jgi:periplasmic protein TonB
MSVRRLDTSRWAVCFTLALCFHGAGAAVLMARWNDDGDRVASAPLIMVELAPVPVTPATAPNDTPPGSQQAEAQAEPEPVKPIEMADLPPTPQAELAVTPKPVEKPKEKVPKKKQASVASAPSTAEHQAERAAAPAPGASAHNPDAVPNWKSQVAARLERFKRYPSEAQARGEQGVTQLAFSVDRAGGVHGARIVRSSGSGALDHATLSLIERAAPLPPPPPEITGTQIAISVPIRYRIR